MYNIAACKMNILVINYSQKERYQTKGKNSERETQINGKNSKRGSTETWDNSKEKNQRKGKTLSGSKSKQ